ncbi:MAG: hypothetical protein Q9M97_01480 [Candidatus Gracilibacteria bacterium]|nr:hypothetical protein [Candidatus Gracilibacteria bacterium]
MIEKVLISDDLINFLERRNLDKQYKKAKNYLLDGYFEKIRFKLKEPKKDGIYYFRINIQFRALCEIRMKYFKSFGYR